MNVSWIEHRTDLWTEKILMVQLLCLHKHQDLLYSKILFHVGFGIHLWVRIMVLLILFYAMMCILFSLVSIITVILYRNNLDLQTYFWECKMITYSGYMLVMNKMYSTFLCFCVVNANTFCTSSNTVATRRLHHIR